MKWPLVIGFTLVGSAFAGEDPGQTAVRYLEQVRAGAVNLDPGKDTALVAVTSESKRKEIAERVQKLGKALGPPPFAVETVKVDDDLAAALIRQEDPLDATKLRVEAVALVRQADRWLPAPVPASFENTAIGYDAERSRRQAMLVEWMRQQQPVALDALRAGAKERLRKTIAAKISIEELRGKTPMDLTRRFLQACQERDEAVVLSLLGGLSKNPPAELDSKVPELRSHFDPKSTSSWRVLVSSNTLLTPIATLDKPDEAGFQIFGVDGAGGFSLVELHFQRDAERLWRLEWPNKFEEDLTGEDLEQRVSLKSVYEAFRRDFPATPCASAPAASRAMLAAVRNGRASEAARLLDLSGDPPSAIHRLQHCVKLRDMLPQPPYAQQWLPLDFWEDGNTAIAAYQVFHPVVPDRASLRTHVFKHTQEGWLWQGNLPDESTRRWIAAKTPEWERSWKPRMLAASTELEAIAQGEAPAETAVRETMSRWENSVAKDDSYAALAETARLNLGDDRSSHFLSNYGNAWADWVFQRGSQQPAPVLGIVRHGRWAGVSLRFQHLDSTRYYPLYPVVQTPAGAKLLLELDLAAGGDRTRDFLNDAALQRLAAQPEAAAELRQLLILHRQLADADRAKSP